jgi:hypothetical protein
MQNQKLRTTLTETQADVASLKNDFMGMRQAVIQHSRILKAVISLLGEESLKAEVERMDAEEQAQAEAQQAEGIKAMTEQGILKAVEASTVKSFIVGQDTFDAVEGQPTRRPQRVQFELAQIKPELQANYLGKKVGDVIEGGGGRFTITEVYDIDVVKAVENAQKQVAAQQAAAAAASQASAPAPEVTPAPAEAPADATVAPQA